MAVAPINFATPQISRDLDFSSLAQLPQVYRQAQARQTLANLQRRPDGTIDTSPLYASGDLSLANLGKELDRNQVMDQRDSRDFQFRQTEAQRAQQNADRLFDLQKRAADRADDKVPEGFERDPATGGLRPIVGGPRSPDYLKTVQDVGGGKSGLQPVYGVDKDGNPVIMQMNPSGTAVQTKLPDGVSLRRDPIRIDRGTDILLLDPVTREPIRTVPKDISGKEAAEVVGQETGKAQVALPQVLSTSNQTLQAIELVRNHPGRAWGTGALGAIPGIPGTQQRGFIAALDQLKGKTFLEAFNSLRGGGAITEAEGAKATNAMARLDRAQNKEDFESALNDLRDVVKSGMMRASVKAHGPGSAPLASPSPPATPAPAAPGGVVDYRTYFGGQ